MRKIIQFVVLVGIILSGILIFKFTSLSHYANPEVLQQMIQSFGVYGPIFYIALYSIAPILAFPGSVLSLAGGLAFGPVLGTVYTVIGASIGATLAFLVARYFGRDFITKFKGLHKGKLQQFDEGIEKNGFSTILVLRLIPIVPFNALNYGAGLSKMKLSDYVFGTVIGIIPGTFAYNFLGGSLKNIFSLQFGLAIFFFLLIAAVPIIYKRYKK